MFRNRHLNFGYLLVIVVAFVIAMSASCKLAYAEAEKEEQHVLIITVDLKGKLVNIQGAVGLPQIKGSRDVTVRKEGSFSLDVSGTKGREIIPAVFFTHEKSDCIIFYFRGKEYEYCF
jgi:hypothetical protein